MHQMLLIIARSGEWRHHSGDRFLLDQIPVKVLNIDILKILSGSFLLVNIVTDFCSWAFTIIVIIIIIIVSC